MLAAARQLAGLTPRMVIARDLKKCLIWQQTCRSELAREPLKLARQARSYRGLVLAAACQLAGFTQCMVIARDLKKRLI